MFFGRIVDPRGVSVDVVTEHVADPPEHELFRFLSGGTGPRVDRLFTPLLLDPATEAGLGGPLAPVRLMKGEMDVAPGHANGLAVARLGLLPWFHLGHPSTFPLKLPRRGPPGY